MQLCTADLRICFPTDADSWFSDEKSNRDVRAIKIKVSVNLLLGSNNNRIGNYGTVQYTEFSKLLFHSIHVSAEASCTMVVRIVSLIRTMVMPISGVIGKTVVQIASAICIGYRHNRSMRFSNKLTYALNYNLPLNKLIMKYIQVTEIHSSFNIFVNYTAVG